MTYLQLVNGVLTRMREDTIASTVGSPDVVAQIVIDLVNDAKRLVEDAHTWNALRDEWSFTESSGQSLYSLLGAGDYAKLEYVYGDDGSELTQRQLKDIKLKKARGITANRSVYYAVNGRDANGDVRLELYPTPTGNAVTYTVGGFKRQADLSADDDVLLVPSKPVLYYALAMAARERGEVGGQTAAELFALASAYLSDAVAWDCSNTDLDNIWTTV